MKDGTCKAWGLGRRFVTREKGGYNWFLTSCIYFNFQLEPELSTERLETRRFVVQHRNKIKTPCLAPLPLVPSTGTLRGWDLLLQAHLIPSPDSLKRELNRRWLLLPRCTHFAPLYTSSTAHMENSACGWDHFNSSVAFCKAVRCLKQLYHSSHRHKSKLKGEDCNRKQTVVGLATQLQTFSCLKLAYGNYPDKCKLLSKKSILQYYY